MGRETIMGKLNTHSAQRSYKKYRQHSSIVSSWAQHSIGTFTHRGRHYDVCVDSSHKAWAVIYIFRDYEKIPVPIFGPVALRGETGSGIEKKLQEIHRKYTCKGYKK